jgi:plasmid stabilization system protein ParE
MIIRWRPTALRDLEALHEHIAPDNENAAAKEVERILDAIDALVRHPEMRRKGRVPGTRELVALPFVIAYRVRAGAIELAAIIHGSRKWPNSPRQKPEEPLPHGSRFCVSVS